MQMQTRSRPPRGLLVGAAQSGMRACISRDTQQQPRAEESASNICQFQPSHINPFTPPFPDPETAAGRCGRRQRGAGQCPALW